MENFSLFSGKHIRCILLLMFSLWFTSVSFATLSGTYTIDNSIPASSTNYQTFATAVADLNTGITGPVTFNVHDAQTFNETGTLTIGPVSGTSVTNTIIFQKNGGGANPVINSTAATSNAWDGIVIIKGVDYVTFDHIDLADVSVGANYIEWGYALLLNQNAAPFDGCQNVTIKNCHITLRQSSSPNTYTATKGIYVGNHEPGIAAGTTRTITATTDASSNCKFYNNTVDKAYYGIYLAGYAASAPYYLYAQNNEIGVSGANTITNFGGGSSACAGIYATNQNNLKIDNNTVNGGSGTTTGFYGIQAATGNNSNVDIIGNTVILTSSATSGSHYGIYNQMGGSGTSNIVNIQNNEIKNCTFVAGSETFFGINQTGAAFTVNVSGNSIHDFSYNGTGTLYGISTAGTAIGTHNIYNNLVYTITKSGNSSSSFIGINYSTGTISFHDNQVYGLTITNNAGNGTSGGALWGISNTGAVTTETNYNNTIHDLSFDNLCSVQNSTLGGIQYSGTSGAHTKTFYNDNVYNLSNSTTSTSTTTVSSVYGISFDGGTAGNLYDCKVYSLSCSHYVAAVYGLYFGPGSSSVTTYNYNAYNNFVSDLNAPNSTSANALVGMCFAGGTVLGTPNVNAYYNTVYINASATGTGAKTYAAYLMPAASTSSYLFLNNNIFVNTTSTASGYTIAFGKNTTLDSKYLSASNNNCFYAGTPGLNNLLFYDGTNSKQTLVDLKTFLDPRDLNSVSVLPSFVNSAGHDLHINAGSSELESAGQPITSPAITSDYDGNLRSATFPDIGADEFSGTKTDNTAPLLSFTPLGNAGSTSARTLTVTLADPSGVPTSGSGRPVLYWRINAGGWNSVTATSLGSNQYSFSFGSGVISGDVVHYYIVAQDGAGTPNVGCYPFAGSSGFTNTPPAVSTPPTSPYSYTIVAGLSGIIPVGSGQTYTTLTGASGLFAAINSGVVSGNIVATIVSNITELGTNALNKWTEDPPNSNYTLTIRPDASSMRTISGSKANAGSPSTNGLVTLNGAKNVFIIGYPSLGSPGIYLTFRNSTTGGVNPSVNTFYLINGSTCSFSYCDIQNNFFDASNAGGSDICLGDGTNNITVQNCNIHDAVADNIGIVKYAIYSSNSSSLNLNIMNITNNNIYNCGVGIWLDQVASGCTITGNSFYYNASSTATSSLPQAGIWTGGNGLAGGGVGNWNISNNYIGGSAPLCGGTPWTNTNVFGTPGGTASAHYFTGIGFRGNSAVTSLIQNNTIQNIAFSYGDMSCIRFSGSMTISGNTIGDPTGTTNLIHGNDGSKGSSGIYGESGSSNYISTIENNTITNLYACNVAAANVSIYAMRLEQACNVRKNKIYGFGFQSVSGSTAPTNFTLFGIYYAVSSPTSSGYEISNNMISLNAVGITSPVIYGIYDGSSTITPLNYYFNTVVLNGSFTGTTNNTIVFNRTTANILNLKNNILYNNITESGTAKHFAIASSTIVGNSLNSDYNDFYVNANPSNLASYPGTSTPLTFSGWKSAISGDPHSSNVTVTTISVTDLHLSGASITDVNLNGIPIGGITTDIDGDTRNIPFMGADEGKTLLTLTAFLEGYTNTGGTAMNYAPSVTVELHNSTAPYTLVESQAGSLGLTGIGTFTFANAVKGSSYYIAVKTWNTVETWCATPQSLTSSSLNYNFTTSAAQAYLSNMTQIGGTGWCIFSGDVNQDGFVNLADYNLINNDSYNLVHGVVVTDLTGDQFTNLADYNIVNNNSYNLVKARTPLLNPTSSVTKPMVRRIKNISK